MIFYKSANVLYGNMTFMSGRYANFNHIKCGNREQEIVEGERNHGHKVRDLLETEHHFQELRFCKHAVNLFGWTFCISTIVAVHCIDQSFESVS